MNKKFLLCLIIILTLFSACTNFHSLRENQIEKDINRDNLLVQELTEDILSALNAKDPTMFKAMFSESVQHTEDIDKRIEAVFGYYHGTFISADTDHINSQTEESSEGIFKISFHFPIESSEGTFIVHISKTIRDAATPENIGLHMFRIAKEGDEEKLPKYNIDTVGIFVPIDKETVLP